MARAFRRRRYLVVPKFQLKFAGLILAFIFGTAIFSAASIYYYMWMTLGDKLAGIYPQGRLVLLLRAANWNLFWRIIVLSPFVAALGIVLSHRIAGPIYRIRFILERVAAGERDLRLQLRKTDELKDVAEAINNVLDSVDKKA